MFSIFYTAIVSTTTTTTTMESTATTTTMESTATTTISTSLVFTRQHVYNCMSEAMPFWLPFQTHFRYLDGTRK